MPGVRYQVSGVREQVSGSNCQVPGFKFTAVMFWVTLWLKTLQKQIADIFYPKMFKIFSVIV